MLFFLSLFNSVEFWKFLCSTSMDEKLQFKSISGIENNYDKMRNKWKIRERIIQIVRNGLYRYMHSRQDTLCYLHMQFFCTKLTNSCTNSTTLSAIHGEFLIHSNIPKQHCRSLYIFVRWSRSRSSRSRAHHHQAPIICFINYHSLIIIGLCTLNWTGRDISILKEKWCWKWFDRDRSAYGNAFL